MTDPNETPMIVTPDLMPGVIATIARYLGALLGGWLIRRGILSDADLPLITGLALALATAGYGAWRSYVNKQALVRAAHSAPDSVAIVTAAKP